MPSADQQQKWWEIPATPTPTPQTNWWDLKEPPPPEQPSAPQSAGLRFIGNLASGLNPINAIRGTYHILRDPYGTLVQPSIDSLSKLKDASTFTEGANAIAGAVPLLGPAADAISAQDKSGDRAGALGQLSALVLAPYAMQGAGAALRGAGRAGSAAVLDASPAVREAALTHRVMPGILRSGESWTAKKLGSTADQVRADISAAGQTPVSLRNLAYAPDAWQTIQSRVNAAPDEAAARNVVSSLRNSVALKPTPTAAGAFRIAEGGFDAARGKENAAAIMERAIAQNAVREVGSVVPQAARSTAKYNDLQNVAHAYALPTLSARLAVSAANRTIGPISQGLHNTGRLFGNPATQETVRALLLAELLGGGRE